MSDDAYTLVKWYCIFCIAMMIAPIVGLVLGVLIGRAIGN